MEKIERMREIKRVKKIKREQEIKRVQEEIKRELQVIRLPSLTLEQLRFRLDNGTKEKKKFPEHERGYEILRNTLHQLEREFEEIQESKQKLEREAIEFKDEWNPWWQVGVLDLDLLQRDPALRELKQKLHNLKCEFEQKLQELNCRQKQILLRVAYLDSQLLAWLLVLYAVHVEDAAHQGGGLRNLVLDGWWLEFWEIVLLAAGDVERNPGPRQITDEQLIQVSDIPIGK
jgi:hypothetical protein